MAVKILPSSIVIVVVVLVVNNHTFLERRFHCHQTTNRKIVFPKQVVNGLGNDLVNCLVIEV